LASLGINIPLSAGTEGPNRALVNNNNHTIAPRLGIAWDPKGNGKWAIRAGVGQFYQREPVGLDEGHTFNAPFVINAGQNRTIETPTVFNGGSVSPSYSKSAQAVVPNSWQFNISAEHELLRNMTLSLGYVGNVGIHLTSGEQINAVPNADWVQAAFLTGTALNALRPADNFGGIAQFQRMGHADYHSLQMLYKWRLSNFSTLQAAYTWSHSVANVFLDDSSGSVSAQAITDNSNTGLDKGDSNINRPNIFVMNEVFYLPKLANKSAFVRGAVGGWELNSILTVSSGSSLTTFSSGAGAYSPQPLKDATGTITLGPCSALDVANGTCVTSPLWTAAGGTPGITALTSTQGSGYTNNNRPNVVPGVGCNSGENGRQILNVNAFTMNGFALGSDGTAGRGICHGPDYRNFDTQLAKNWYFKEHYRVKFSMDFFNMFNHANFYSLEGTNWNATGLICGNPQTGGTGFLPATYYLPCSATNNVVTKQAGGQNSQYCLATSVHPGREIQYSLRFYF